MRRAKGQVIDMDILFENRYERTKGFHKEIISYSFFKWLQSLAVYIVLTLIMIFCSLALLLPGVFSFDNTTRIFFLFLAIVVVMLIVRYVRTVEISYKRDLEINNGKPADIKVILTNDEIEVCSVNSGSKNHISYQHIRKIITTRNYYVLSTEAKHYIAFRKDGFVMGTPDEFISFIKSKVKQDAQKSKPQYVFICLASVIALSVAVFLYTANGRTIFENRAEPTEAEMEKIHEIISFEQAKLSECMELLAHYDERIKELGIEIRPMLEQNRAVNNQGLVEKHDWNKDNWLPKFYSSIIICYVFKDGKRLENRTSNDTVSYFVEIYWLLYAGKNENTTYNETPFDYFDTGFDNLLSQVSIFLSR